MGSVVEFLRARRFGAECTAIRIVAVFVVVGSEVSTFLTDRSAFLAVNFWLAIVAGAFALVPDPYVLDREWVPDDDELRHRIIISFPALKLLNYTSHSVTLGTVFFTFGILILGEAGNVTQAEASWTMAASLLAGFVAAYKLHEASAFAVSTALLWLAINKMDWKPTANAGWAQYVNDGLVALAIFVLAVLLVIRCVATTAAYIVKKLQYPAAASFGLCFGAAYLSEGWHHYTLKASDSWTVFTPLACTFAYTAVVVWVQKTWGHGDVTPPHGTRRTRGNEVELAPFAYLDPNPEARPV